MEFPELGTHCAVASCSKLDFLPFECDACHRVFCKEHKTYEQHNCTEAYTKDVRVPVCPLCNQPVPVNRGEDPNLKVDEHIQKDCKSDKAKKSFSNRCNHPGCKKKELVPVTCSTCRKNFCFKHRFETDHNCQGHPNRQGARPGGTHGGSSPASRHSASSGANRKPQMTAMSQIGADLNRERMQRQQQRQSQQHKPPNPTSQHMSEDEALALAMAASMNETSGSEPPQSHSNPPPSVDSYAEDEALARAIAASLKDQPKPKPRRPPRESTRQRNKDSDCTIS